jgi:hypothetical protein
MMGRQFVTTSFSTLSVSRKVGHVFDLSLFLVKDDSKGNCTSGEYSDERAAGEGPSIRHDFFQQAFIF